VESSFPIRAKIVVGVCAVVDAAALLMLVAGAEAVGKCGAAPVLGLLKWIGTVGFGIVPIGIALAAVGTAFLMPELRKPGRWLLSAALLTLIAVGAVTQAHARFLKPTDPAWCSF
jgi:hypothetical protein